ncbi:MAG TPA: hypothetical protein VFC63_12760 [Blastocatellia bacterium]|nr:hypothetical protein [Blastocatellia bacterium]
MSLMKLFEAITDPFNREVQPNELRAGDIIALPHENVIISDIEDDQITVTFENGSESGIEWKPQMVVRRIPDNLDYWIFISLTRGDSINCYALEKHCWKCKQFGYVMALETGNCLITDGPDIFRYPGVRRQLREFFAERPDVRTRFGRVRKRFSKTRRQEVLSQGCPDCDAIWGDFHISELFTSCLNDLEASLSAGSVVFAFELQLERLFDEGEIPQPKPEAETGVYAHPQ